MVQKLIKKITLWIVGTLGICSLLAYFGVTNMPLMKLNDFTQVTLSATGTVSNGNINGVTIKEQKLPLTCQISGNLLLTDIYCDNPLNIKGKIHLSVDGSVEFKNFTIKGKLKKASAWLSLLQLPPGLDAEVDMNIVTMKVDGGYTKPILSKIDVFGNITDISILTFPLFTSATIKTEEPNNPIKLTVDAKNSNQPDSKLNLLTVLKDNVYETKGSLTGKNLTMLSGILSYFGRPVSSTEWQIILKGKVF